ncbi:MAG: ATP-binding cassette domain-containing protein, partial [Pseudomonadota bacterium]
MYEARQKQYPVLELRNLRFDVAGRTLLNIPQLSINRTGVTVIMGPNGAGKSLLLRLCHGLIGATSGDILHNGEPVAGASIFSRSLVLQTPVLLRRSTEANVKFVLKSRGLSIAKAEELLKRVSLNEQRKTAARLLSGGEKQRLAIAQALATNPALLMLDEPAANLDPTSTFMVEEIVKDSVARETAVLLVTHDAAQARRLADEVVFLHDGKVVETATASRFFHEP